MNHMTLPKTGPNQQKVDKIKPIIHLISDDLTIRRDERILEEIKHLYRNTYSRFAYLTKPPKPHPLYYRYRMEVFPLIKVAGVRVPKWRDISPWLKAQIACMVLHEVEYRQFRIHIDQNLIDSWEADGKDIKTEFRNRLARHLKRKFDGITPMLYFVLEAHDTDGQPTRPHVHGAVEMLQCPLPTKGYESRKLSQLARENPIAARKIAGRIRIRQAFLTASGATSKNSRTPTSSRCNMHWSKPPTQAIFNTEAVDYAFKNVSKSSSELPENRIVMLNGSKGNGLRGRAEALWNVIRGSADEHNRMGLPPLST
jgi:hypothetical protein